MKKVDVGGKQMPKVEVRAYLSFYRKKQNLKVGVKPKKCHCMGGLGDFYLNGFMRLLI